MAKSASSDGEKGKFSPILRASSKQSVSFPPSCFPKDNPSDSPPPPQACCVNYHSLIAFNEMLHLWWLNKRRGRVSDLSEMGLGKRLLATPFPAWVDVFRAHESVACMLVQEEGWGSLKAEFTGELNGLILSFLPLLVQPCQKRHVQYPLGEGTCA